MQARAAQIAVDDADTLSALRERDRNAASDRRFPSEGAALEMRSLRYGLSGFMNMRFVRMLRAASAMPLSG